MAVGAGTAFGQETARRYGACRVGTAKPATFAPHRDTCRPRAYPAVTGSSTGPISSGLGSSGNMRARGRRGTEPLMLSGKVIIQGLLRRAGFVLADAWPKSLVFGQQDTGLWYRFENQALSARHSGGVFWARAFGTIKMGPLCPRLDPRPADPRPPARRAGSVRAAAPRSHGHRRGRRGLRGAGTAAT